MLKKYIFYKYDQAGDKVYVGEKGWVARPKDALKFDKHIQANEYRVKNHIDLQGNMFAELATEWRWLVVANGESGKDYYMNKNGYLLSFWEFTMLPKTKNQVLSFIKQGNQTKSNFNFYKIQGYKE